MSDDENAEPANANDTRENKEEDIPVNEKRSSAVEDKKEEAHAPKAPDTRDIWTQLLELKKQEDAAHVDSGREASIMCIGPRHSGKSTLIHSYMFKDKEDTPKPTTSLDYKYTRSSVGMSMEKDLSHFWELGGGRSLVSLMDICLTPETLAHTLIIISIDLSRPSAVLDDVTYWIDVVRKRVKSCLSKLTSTDIPKKLADAAKEQFDANHPDLGQLDLIDVPVLIVANKFDAFANSDPQLLNVMSKTLRSIAHTNGCSLLYASKKHKTLTQTFRSRVSRHVLNRPPSKTIQLESTKPISVQAGGDSFEQIGEGGSVATWSRAFAKYFPANEKDKELTVAVDELELAAEPTVDQMLAVRDEDLKAIVRKLALDRRMKKNDAEMAKKEQRQ